MRRLILLAALLLAACQPAPKLHTEESYVFGTRVEVLVWGAPEEQAKLAVGEVLREFDRLHRTYHAWQPSELTALNDAIAAGRSIEVAPELAQLVRESQTLAARGDHLFDPGIGALVQLWGFHDDSFKAQLPDPAALARLVQAKPSIADLTIDGNRIASANPAVALDFGGYLKGVALDRAAAILKRRGVANALINIGGNVMALGSKGGTPWRVGIQSPRAPTPLATLDLRDGEAVGTSGDYQRYFELDGRRYCHLIDPRSGAPAQGTQAVTVLIPPQADAGMWSDWSSKPIFIAGPGWRAMAARLGLSHVLRVDAAGKIEMTDAMRARLTMAAPP
ncbi:MAG: FAD:protein FMN transferase [Rhodocyclaceae bacterium]|nr:FAD:protein FMN transferase [Rhodocyclaceae bacterium]